MLLVGAHPWLLLHRLDLRRRQHLSDSNFYLLRQPTNPACPPARPFFPPDAVALRPSSPPFSPLQYSDTPRDDRLPGTSLASGMVRVHMTFLLPTHKTLLPAAQTPLFPPVSLPDTPAITHVHFPARSKHWPMHSSICSGLPTTHALSSTLLLPSPPTACARLDRKQVDL